MTRTVVIDGREIEEYELRCPDCGAMMTLRSSQYGLFYGCSMFPQCRATHGAHPWGAPLGVPAKRDVKLARIQAHVAFDRLWKSGRLQRSDAYRWLQSQLGLAEGEAHIGRFDKDTCARVIEVVEAALGPPEEFRAGGDTTCTHCGKPYRDHPHDLAQLGSDSQPFLHILCDGSRVKL